ncbi:MAG: dihydropteroate synthase, partial [Rhodothermales bacterium]
DGGTHFNPDDALRAGLQMIADGADILDVGGESTRPGAPRVSADEECSRVVPVISRLSEASDTTLSIDTTKASVARAAIAAGASIINDISGFERDPAMIPFAAESASDCVVMHMRGTPQTMQQNLHYNDLVGEIRAYFQSRIDALRTAGVADSAIILDPGIGFAKSAEQNLILIQRLAEFADLGFPILLGPSRKSFIGRILGIEDPAERIWGTAASVAIGIANGASIIRVHDVREMRQVCDLAAAISDSAF